LPDTVVKDNNKLNRNRI